MEWTLICGASSGIGLEIALELASQKYPLVVHYQTGKDKALEAVKRCRSLGVPCEMIQGDFHSEEGVDAFCNEYQSRFGLLKNFIYSAGSYLVKPGSETSYEEWMEIYQMNFFCPLKLSLYFTPLIKKSQGSLLFLGMAGLNRQAADIYSTAFFNAKVSLLQWVRSMAKELAKDNVRVNMLSPGYAENSMDRPSSFDHILDQRMVDLSEIAGATTYLLSKKARMITGQNLEISGAVRL